jgi:protein phosphatase
VTLYCASPLLHGTPGLAMPAPETAMAQASLFRWQSASLSDVGCVRSVNEDACLEQPERGLWAVADGMGGHTLGDVASRMVVDALARMRGGGDLATRAAEVRACLADVNRRLMTEAAMREVQTIGSTVVVLLAGDARCLCLWAGDSRIYLYRAGTLQQLTRDHSHVEDLVSRGMLSADEARRHPARNLITRAVGVADQFDMDEVELQVMHGDIFLLCSDGLSNEAGVEEIAALLAGSDVRAATAQLVERALAHGGRDNISVVTVRAISPEHDDATALNPALA